MTTVSRALRRFAVVLATTFVSLVAAMAASAMPLVPEGDPPIRVRYADTSLEAAGAAGGAGSGGVDWSTALVSAAYAAAFVLIVLAVAFAAVRARQRSRGVVAPTA